MPDILTYLTDQGIPTDDLYASLGLDDLDRHELALLIEEQSGGELTIDSIPYETWDTLADVLETAGKMVMV